MNFTIRVFDSTNPKAQILFHIIVEHFVLMDEDQSNGLESKKSIDSDDITSFASNGHSSKTSETEKLM
jgi:hypothetical protein